MHLGGVEHLITQIQSSAFKYGGGRTDSTYATNRYVQSNGKEWIFDALRALASRTFSVPCAYNRLFPCLAGYEAVQDEQRGRCDEISEEGPCFEYDVRYPMPLLEQLARMDSSGLRLACAGV